MFRHTPDQISRRKVPRAVIAPLVASIAFVGAGCSSASKAEAPVMPTPSSASANIHPTASSPSPETASSTVGVTVEALVCDALMAQQQPDGQWRLYGRPAVEKVKTTEGKFKYIPEDVETNSYGVQISAITPERPDAAQQWYDLHGQKLNDPSNPNPNSPDKNTRCAEQTLSSVEIHPLPGHPNISVQVATANPDPQHVSRPHTWDSRALDPTDFSGVGLDYGEMNQFGVHGVIDQANAWYQQSLRTPQP